METRRIEFTNGNGQRLKGLLDLPLGQPRAFALFAHCFTCGKNLKSARTLSRTLADTGIATLRFDFTGLGQSEGDFADTSFSSNVEDLLAAAAFLEKSFEAPALLIGHSLGGTAILQVAGQIPSASAVVTIGSPAEPQHVEHLLSGSEADFERDGEAVVKLGGRDFRLKKNFVDDLKTHKLSETIKHLGKALLIFHSPLDSIVSIDNASELYRQALHPKSFVTLDKADHLLSRVEDAQYVADVIASWARRYLPAAPAQDDDAVVAVTPASGFRTAIRVGKHGLVADEPVSVAGATDTGPSPYGLLSAALASCTSMTLQMYARHKKIPLDRAEVRVSHQRIHAKDCIDCETADGFIDQFNREITLHGSLADDVRERMLEIADRCPVHKTLHREVEINTRAADDS